MSQKSHTPLALGPALEKPTSIEPGVGASNHVGTSQTQPEPIKYEFVHLDKDKPPRPEYAQNVIRKFCDAAAKGEKTVDATVAQHALQTKQNVSNEGMISNGLVDDLY